MKYLLLIALVLSAQAMAGPEPVTSPNDIVRSCGKYGMFVMVGKTLTTGKVTYSTFSCRHLFDSDNQPNIRNKEDKAAKKILTRL